MKKFWILDLLKYYEIITKVIIEVKKLYLEEENYFKVHWTGYPEAATGGVL